MVTHDTRLGQWEAQHLSQNQLTALLERGVTFYRITLDELAAYDGGTTNLHRIHKAKEAGQDHLLMLMFPEGEIFDDSQLQHMTNTIRRIDAIRGKDRSTDPQKRNNLLDRGYLLIREPAIIERIEELLGDKIRSFKEDLFPGENKVQPRPAINRSYNRPESPTKLR